MAGKIERATRRGIGEGCGLVTPGKTSADDDDDSDGASAAACGNGSTSAEGCDCGGTNCCGGESEAGNRGGNGVDIRYSATKMIAASAGQTGRLTAGLQPPVSLHPKPGEAKNGAHAA
jgi:hypothetical protein